MSGCPIYVWIDITFKSCQPDPSILKVPVNLWSLIFTAMDVLIRSIISLGITK